jgi:hypothetical protein
MGLPAVSLVPPIVDEDTSGGREINVRTLVKRQQEAMRSGRVQEVMSTSDLTYLADVIDRGLMVSYLDDSIPITYPMLGKRRDTTTLARAGSGHGVDYRLNAARLIPQVAEGADYTTIDPSDESFEAHTYKYGVNWPVTWETWLSDNRDLGLLMEYPQSWGLSARYTQQYLFTSAYAHNTTLFTAGQGNYMSGAGSNLTAENLATGVNAIRNFADPAGNVSVYAGPLYLVVPPTLEWTARALVESTVVTTGNTASIPVNNPAARSATVVVDPFLEAIDKSYGTTGWYLFADPRIRPAVRYGFLRGYETPSIYVREADARMLFGGATDPFDGDFLTDEIAFKLRFTFGVDAADWRGAYHSTGEAKAK